jgi:GTP-binding protein
MLNALTRKKGLARVSATPGRTRALQFFDIAYRPTPAARPRRVRFCDLPGYGYAKVSREERDRWAAMIEDYLRGRDVLRAVVLIVDARHAPAESDVDAAAFLRGTGRRVLVAATKMDKLPRTRRGAALRVVEDTLGLAKGEAVPFSAIEALEPTRLGAHRIRRVRRGARAGRGRRVARSRAVPCHTSVTRRRRGREPVSTPISRGKSGPKRPRFFSASPTSCRISSPRFGANIRPSPAPTSTPTANRPRPVKRSPAGVRSSSPMRLRSASRSRYFFISFKFRFMSIEFLPPASGTAS